MVILLIPEVGSCGANSKKGNWSPWPKTHSASRATLHFKVTSAAMTDGGSLTRPSDNPDYPTIDSVSQADRLRGVVLYNTFPYIF